MNRTANIERNTAETRISVQLTVDGNGNMTAEGEMCPVHGMDSGAGPGRASIQPGHQ